MKNNRIQSSIQVDWFQGSIQIWQAQQNAEMHKLHSETTEGI